MEAGAVTLQKGKPSSPSRRQKPSFQLASLVRPCLANVFRDATLPIPMKMPQARWDGFSRDKGALQFFGGGWIWGEFSDLGM